ncbi:MAG: C40 family peptidase [Bacteroidales bacterium]|nr:C40 family peptidase [Bacteroidales bacterium]
MFGITFFSVVPIRREPSETSEMISQLLFGELFEIVEQTDKWAMITSLWDGYQGWVDWKMITEITKDEFDGLNKSPKTFTLSIFTKIIDDQTGYSQLLPAGSVLYNFDLGKTRCYFLSKSFVVENYDNSLLNAGITDIAKQFLNAPYLWGGRTYFGIDCSGYSQLICRLKGISLSRDAKDQAMKGNSVNMVHEIKPGDLAFFDNEEGNIIHVGILINSHTIIHASGKVRIDKFDQQGIFDETNKQYIHHLRMIKRITD